ncbi:hypothetical protein [Actinoplanes aureus]|uniref:Uncharacterized protein n=1 Tax=Actinoplanes aureus TaxID=2792083 RepID=A0A931G0A9_9ACTN|nr:hypothetical protein [Actinoplanes aureus]MBG0561209.1 hypothetical protein [Actinoplanes aureus]
MNQINSGYPAAQHAKAAETAASHPDEATRERARERIARWAAVLSGMLSGELTIGSRTPIAGLPAWVTPEVIHGGFATGAAAAGGPLTPWEIEYARRHDLPRTRTAIFEHRLGEEGLRELTEMVTTGGYRLSAPEETALPVLAWLAQEQAAPDRAAQDQAVQDQAAQDQTAQDQAAELARARGDEAIRLLLAAIGPYRDRLRFAPEPAPASGLGSDVVWRTTVGEVRTALEHRSPRPRIETMRGTLQVWNGYADRVLELWLRTSGDGRIGVHLGPDFERDAHALLAEYPRLAAVSPPSRRHAGPKANLTTLRTALADVLAGRPWRRGLVQTVTDAMVRRRGTPGSPAHAALRARQAADAALPPHHLIAHAVAARLAALPQHTGTTEIAQLVAPITLPPAAHMAETQPGYAVTRAPATPGADPAGVPVCEVPPAVRAVVRRALAAPVEELVDAGLVPSAEVLAGLAPRMAAQAVAAGYPDRALRELMAAGYLAFRGRRSLLLTGLESQVRPGELPWVRAVAAHRTAGDGTRGAAAATLRRLGQLTVRTFPATLIPNPMVRELTTLSREAELGLPWVEELAADIFDGRFAAKFLNAAQIAGELLSGTIYARYYGIDYAAVAFIQDVRPAWGVTGPPVSARFAQLCRDRAGVRQERGRPAQNGMVIEQAQILTTHNLATLVHRAGVRLAPDGAARCFALAEKLSGRLAGPNAYRTVKDLAYAWRQMIFHLSVDGGARRFVAELPERGPLAPAVAGLREVVEGGRTRPLTGWTTERHWLLPRS